jgi:hypothetical protein
VPRLLAVFSLVCVCAVCATVRARACASAFVHSWVRVCVKLRASGGPCAIIAAGERQEAREKLDQRGAITEARGTAFCTNGKFVLFK